jgi:hypothetical protein
MSTTSRSKPYPIDGVWDPLLAEIFEVQRHTQALPMSPIRLKQRENSIRAVHARIMGVAADDAPSEEGFRGVLATRDLKE